MCKTLPQSVAHLDSKKAQLSISELPCACVKTPESSCETMQQTYEGNRTKSITQRLEKKKTHVTDATMLCWLAVPTRVLFLLVKQFINYLFCWCLT